MTKEDIQKKATELIVDHNNLILQWCTSLGKSKAAIDIVKKTEATTVLLIVAEIAHKENWKKEFLRWGLPSNTGVVIDTYASLKNHRNESYNLLILDEGHHAGSDLRLDILGDIIAEKVLVLSATLTSEVLTSLTNVFGSFYNYKISLSEAIEWNVLPEPKIYLIEMELDTTYPTQTIIEEWGKSETKTVIKTTLQGRWDYMKDKLKYPNVRLEIKCTEREKYDYITAQIEYWKSMYMRKRIEFMKNKWLHLGSERKRFLGDLKSNQANNLIHKLQSKRYVCFCTSIAQAELLGNRNAIHSGKKDSLSIIDSFNDKKISNLFAVGMIQEGQNLTDIEAGVIIQLDGQERAFIQKTGRAMRAESPTLYVFYYSNTRDEDYLKNVLENIDSEYITEVDNIYELRV